MEEKFATGVADPGGKFATGVVDTGGAPWLANISAKFRKNSKRSKLINEKNQKQKISRHCPFNHKIKFKLIILPDEPLVRPVLFQQGPRQHTFSVNGLIDTLSFVKMSSITIFIITCGFPALQCDHLAGPEFYELA